MFIFLLTPFDTKDCYHFGLNLGQMLLMKVLFIKKVTLSHEFIFVYLVFQWADIFGKVLPKRFGEGRGGQKKYKKGNSHIGKLSIEGRLNPLPTVIGLYYICWQNK